MLTELKGIRCAVCWSEETARLAKAHNDANMISIGQRLVSEQEALAIVAAWLRAQFEGGRRSAARATTDNCAAGAWPPGSGSYRVTAGDQRISAPAFWGILTSICETALDSATPAPNRCFPKPLVLGGISGSRRLGNASSLCQ